MAGEIGHRARLYVNGEFYGEVTLPSDLRSGEAPEEVRIPTMVRVQASHYEPGDPLPEPFGRPPGLSVVTLKRQGQDPDGAWIYS